MNLQQQIQKARSVSVPLILPETSDPAATIKTVMKAINGKKTEVPIIGFDGVRGFYGMNDAGLAFIKGIDEGGGIGAMLAAMSSPATLEPQGGVLFWHQPDWNNPQVVQGVWLLRDSFKAKGWTWIGLAPTANLPAQLRLDVVVIPEKFPDRAELDGIVTRIIESTNASARKAKASELVIEPPVKAEVVRSLRGLNSFSAEQCCYFNLDTTGIDPKGCWAFKLNTVKQSQGCEMSVINPDFSSLAGLRSVKEFMGGIINGKKPIDVFVFLDEIEKMTSGQGTDTSGVTTKMIGQFLTGTQDRRWKGVILTGVPGTGKTFTGQSCSGEARAVFFKVSFSEMQSSLVGSSEANMKTMFSTVDALGENVFMIATCNNMASLTPEMVARFRMGTFFYDFPDEEERAALWKLYMKQYSLPDQAIPPSQGWVGREIESACEKADMMNKPLVEVARFVVPQTISQRSKLEEVRSAASGRYLSASYPGLFQSTRIQSASDGVRAINIQ
jgi:hypothetical protein